VTQRPTLDQMTSNDLDQLHADLDRAEIENAELRDALAHCPEREPRQRAEAAIDRVRAVATDFLHEYEGGPDPCAAAVLATLDEPKDQA
jgi:hypothetical protein